MPRDRFTSAKLQADGTVVVTGPFSPGQGEPNKPALVAFYLVQNATKVDGDGRWEPGATEWNGTGGKGLKTGPAMGTALAVHARNDPPGFLTISWTAPVEVTEAD